MHAQLHTQTHIHISYLAFCIQWDVRQFQRDTKIECAAVVKRKNTSRRAVHCTVYTHDGHESTISKLRNILFITLPLCNVFECLFIARVAFHLSYFDWGMASALWKQWWHRLNQRWQCRQKAKAAATGNDNTAQHSTNTQ